MEIVEQNRLLRLQVNELQQRLETRFFENRRSGAFVSGSSRLASSTPAEARAATDTPLPPSKLMNKLLGSSRWNSVTGFSSATLSSLPEHTALLAKLTNREAELVELEERLLLESKKRAGTENSLAAANHQIDASTQKMSSMSEQLGAVQQSLALANDKLAEQAVELSGAIDRSQLQATALKRQKAESVELAERLGSVEIERKQALDSASSNAAQIRQLEASLRQKEAEFDRVAVELQDSRSNLDTFIGELELLENPSAATSDGSESAEAKLTEESSRDESSPNLPLESVLKENAELNGRVEQLQGIARIRQASFVELSNRYRELVLALEAQNQPARGVSEEAT